MNLGQMRTKARILLDEASEAFWTDTEIDWYINIAYKLYYNTLVYSDYNRLRAAPALLNIVSGAETVALPSDFLSAKKLERVYPYKTVPLSYVERFEGSNYTNVVCDLPSWTIRGASIVLEPTPNESVTNGLKLHYYPMPSEMVNNTDSPDAGFISTFHDMLPVKAAILAKEGRQEADTGGLQSFLAKLEEPFISVTENCITTRQYSAPFMSGEEDI